MTEKEYGSYQCPRCGQPTTRVRNTMSFDNHIMRRRVCLTCGETHETIEMRVDSMSVLNFANRITREAEAEAARASGVCA